MAVSVVATFQVNEGQQAEFAGYLREMIDITKQEDGCIAYDLYGATDGSSECVMVEIWESRENLDLHLDSDHFKKFIPGTEAFLCAPASIKIYNRL